MLRRVRRAEKPRFERRFQEYLRELAQWNGAQPNRHGEFEYAYFDAYWHESERMPFFIDADGEPAGLLLLRKLPPRESPDDRTSLQVAEICVFPPHRRRGVARRAIRIAARMARERALPLTWSAYMNNDAANALYVGVLHEFAGRDGAWVTKRTRGIDHSGIARFYYAMEPIATMEAANQAR
jgi:predicted acetyltransferase